MDYFNTYLISKKFIITQAIDMFYKKSYNGSDTKDAIIRGNNMSKFMKSLPATAVNIIMSMISSNH